jgi:hypothetical protein
MAAASASGGLSIGDDHEAFRRGTLGSRVRRPPERFVVRRPDRVEVADPRGKAAEPRPRIL